MTGRAAAQLAERLQLLDRHVFIAEQVMQRILQHRAMPGGKHEAVAVGPIRLRRIDAEEAIEEHRRHIGHAHRHAGMSGIGLLHRVHCQRADRIGHVGLGHRHFLRGLHCGSRGHAFPPTLRLYPLMKQLIAPRLPAPAGCHERRRAGSSF